MIGPVCHACGYSREGLPGGVPCPECGELPEPVDEPWAIAARSSARTVLGLGVLSVMGVIGCGVPGIALGLCTLVATGVAYAGLPRGAVPPRATRRTLWWGMGLGVLGVVGGMIVMSLGLALL